MFDQLRKRYDLTTKKYCKTSRNYEMLYKPEKNSSRGRTKQHQFNGDNTEDNMRQGSKMSNY